MLPIHFAPIQGQTDLCYRQSHHRLCNGIECYYTPFVRWEKSSLRNKDVRDIGPSANQGIPTAVQIIFKDRDEFCHLCDAVEEMGWRRIDLNMGCPFPLQTHAGRGAGILKNTEILEQIALEISNRPEVTFSVKMRPGLDSEEEGLRIIPLLDSLPLQHVAIHPRLGCQQYKGTASREVFSKFYAAMHSPLIYNGDITTPDQMKELETTFPNLHGVMIGRGLLSRPTLAQEYLEGQELSLDKQLEAILAIHDSILSDASGRLQGESQLLARMQTFWEPIECRLDRKTFKSLTRCGSLRNYREAVVQLRKALNSHNK